MQQKMSQQQQAAAAEEESKDMMNVSTSAESTHMTIGDALEITALTAGNKPIEQSDVAAIRAAEIRASGSTHITGVAVAAQVAADQNNSTISVENKVKLGDILKDASYMLEGDKPVTREDAERVTEEEVENNPDRVTYPGGVSSSMGSAARLNQDATN